MRAICTIEVESTDTIEAVKAKKRSKTSTESIMGRSREEPSSRRVRVNDKPPHPIQSISLSEKKPYKCDFEGCDYACKTSGSLKTHKRTHTKEGQARQKKQEQRVAKALDLAGYTMITAGGVVSPPMHYKREHHVDFVCVGDIDGLCSRRFHNLSVQWCRGIPGSGRGPTPLRVWERRM